MAISILWPPAEVFFAIPNPFSLIAAHIVWNSPSRRTFYPLEIFTAGKISVNFEEKSNKGLWRLVLSGASGILALKIFSLGMGFLINVMFARLLGAKDFGAYAFALSWAGLLGVPAVMGLDCFLVRKIYINNMVRWVWSESVYVHILVQSHFFILSTSIWLRSDRFWYW